MQEKNLHRDGFTIVELLIVIVVIGILAAITIVSFNGVQQRANEATLKTDLSAAVKQVASGLVDNPAYLSTVSATGEGLQKSSGTLYQYSSVSANEYCLTAVSTVTGTKTFFYSSTNNTVSEGTCPGHDPDGIALSCPSGFIVVPGNTAFSTSDFCVMKYEAKRVGSTNVPISQAAGVPWTTIVQPTAIANSPNVAGCTGCHMITEAEWLTIAANVTSVPSNWSGGSVGNGYIYSGSNDTSPANGLAASTDDNDGYYLTGNSGDNQRRTLRLTNGQIIWDFAGNVWEMTSGQYTGNQPGASGWAYREWNTTTNTGTLSANAFPAFGVPAASAWTSAHGIGQLYSSTSNNGIVRAMTRGGAWGDLAGAGVYSLNLSVTASSAQNSGIGFRVAR